MAFQVPRGTRDLLPEDMARMRRVFETARRVFENYGYGEVMTPAFESLELLEAKGALGGEAVKDVYRFEDKSGRKLGLIFDPTTPIARIVASNPSLPKPVKWYYIRRMWRYEKPQAGRYREFWQCGLELIGTDKPEADAEMLAITSSIMNSLGVRDFTLRVNSRKVIEAMARVAGIPKEKENDAFRAIDKLDKVGEKEVRDEMERSEIPSDAIDAFIGLTKITPDELEKKLGKDKQAVQDLEELKAIIRKAKAMGVRNAQIDSNVVRGLDYYTGFIFETLVKGNEKLGSVCSGGRYDKLIDIYGGDPTPATGFGMGANRIALILKDDEPYQWAKVLVAPAKDEVKDKAFEIAAQLREAGISTDIDMLGRNLRKQFDYANSRSIPFVIVVGPKELAEKSVIVRDMKTGKEEKVKISTLPGFFAQ